MYSAHLFCFGRHATVRLRAQDTDRRAILINRTHKSTVRAAYDVEVEPPPRAPNSAPRFGGPLPPPPPPPPPPPRAMGGLQAPSRRELLFGALGMGLGVGGTYAYYNRPIDPSEIDTRLTELLDELMDDESLLETLGQEVGLRNAIQESEEAITALEGLKQVEESLDEVIQQVTSGEQPPSDKE
ncbi:hypothetical protein VOLCADRAFT_87459 [Volvox carteri f. nagariensis]|uniref:Uncharacterized protein n=1 Tax=Volvox carteri f. nagariensis TaxID=3068 RepID=D8TLE2_VOLCA|nr:uncharacterized protein VOLCADRAFT_87459 [Volvox carteri f. nagariensis]EFJ51859.1 hypothetical protein VOLCADRAFT_87459 [Volvox carteri f. nagariensis]|eukprot:XP_002947269.1 hypothetical protein VOLCADRAFT_87459 [Volvox carteri f. nagariensis]